MSTSLAPAARPHAATAPQLGSTGVCDPVLRMRKLSNGQAKGLAWAGCLRGRSPGCSVSSRWGNSARSKPGAVNGSPKVAGLAPAAPSHRQHEGRQWGRAPWVGTRSLHVHERRR